MMEVGVRESSVKAILTPQHARQGVGTDGGGGLITAGITGGVWICPAYKQAIHVCRGSLVGEFSVM